MQSRHRFLWIAVVAVLSLGCPSGEKAPDAGGGGEGATDELAATDVTVAAAELSPAPPDTTIASVTNATGQVDMFAWKTFIALNWPAIVPSATNGYTRGIPDTTQSFGADKLTVWETFKEKREVFNRGTVSESGEFTPEDPGPWYSAVDYGTLRAADGEVLNSPQPHPAGARVFHSTIKQVFDALDETIEVKSEEREGLDPTLPPDVMPLNNNAPVPTGSLVAPRVWRYDSTTDTRTPVFYEVKVNYDFYNYARDTTLWGDNTGLWDDATAEAAAKTNDIHLPWRTSATMKLPTPFPPPAHAPQASSDQTNAKTGYDAGGVAATYGTFQSNQPPPSAPPLIGSVHIKAAWIALSPDEIAAKTYHMAEAYTYKSNDAGEPVAEFSTFGLIGLHIIQRIHFSDTDGNFEGAGGTFVFATWEHNSIQNSIDNPGTKTYEYSNFYDPSMNGLSGQAGFGTVYKVTRRPGAVLAQTTQANTTAHNTLLPSGSVWQNYNLIGTQFMAVDTPDDVAFSAPPSAAQMTLGQNSYLANLVLETNHGLQNFRGLPPLLLGNDIVPTYKNSSLIKPPLVGNSNSGPVFDRNALNIASGGTGHNMGGCMGCHGVAQSQGFNFSFVLLGGNDGAKTDTETRFDLPIANVSSK